jgi:phytoene synthase
MSADLPASYAHCQLLARQAAGNFFYSFLVLPRAKRRAMCALYAFLRHTDDLGDSTKPVETRRAELADWRHSLEDAFQGRYDSPILPALVDAVARHAIRREYLFEAIDGVEMDQAERSYETFAELERYCYKVASVVGLACIHIWGFSDSAAIDPATNLGIAFQLTNILRDLKEDVLHGRVYLPQEDLRRFEYTADDLARGVRDGRFQALMQFEIARAEDFYRRGAPLEKYLARDSQAAFRAMVGIYRAVLDEIKRRDGDVFTSRVELATWRKIAIAISALLARPGWARSVALGGAQL